MVHLRGRYNARRAETQDDVLACQQLRYLTFIQTRGLEGAPEALDTDEFDTPVLLHELGHYLQWVYDFYDVVPGNFHNGADTDARLAWGEGWASFFSSAVRGTGFYGDSIGEGLAYDLDVEALPLSLIHI